MLIIGNTSQAELPTLGDPTLDSISTREEAQLGLSYYRYLKASLPIVEDIQLNYYLESLAQKLVTQSDEAGRKFTFSSCSLRLSTRLPYRQDTSACTADFFWMPIMKASLQAYSPTKSPT